ncbi:MAG: sulfatase family protein [Planctomycetota bacterium]|jgi:arylsulfatase A-like enzyme
MKPILTALTLLILTTSTPAAQPNFIIVFNDDQGYQDLGCFGSPNIHTPNIDALAAGGMRFTDFYSAYCVCSASRASLMTGSYQPRISMRGVLGPNSNVGLHPDEVTIADMLKTRNYATAMVGKWHLGDKPQTLPAAQGFDTYLTLPYSNDMARKKGWGNATEDLDKIWRLKKYDIYNNVLVRDGRTVESPVNQITLTDRYTAAALEFIEAKHKQPFFLYLANTMPHVPLFVSDERYDEDPHLAYKLTIEHIDWQVGQITKTLDRLDIADNTFIVFTSDNGPWLSKDHHGGSALPLRAGKTTTYEGGMRVPTVMRWPDRIKPGQTCSRVAGTIDLLPTFARIVGAKLPADRPIDGRDISALLDNPDAPSPHEREGYYYYKNSKLEAVRLGDWKLHLKNPKKLELYNLKTDIAESNNLAAGKPNVVKRITAVARTYDEALKASARPMWEAAKPKDKK